MITLIIRVLHVLGAKAHAHKPCAHACSMCAFVLKHSQKRSPEQRLKCWFWILIEGFKHSMGTLYKVQSRVILARLL